MKPLLGYNSDIYARMDENGRQQFDAHIEELASNAIKMQGDAAFEYPRRDAAIHEAGHAIWHTANGVRVTRCKIWRETFNGKRVWLGITNFAGEHPAVTPTSTPDDDLDYARNLIAGITSEMAFLGKDFRFGSSLDEVALFRMCVSNAFLKKGGGTGMQAMALAATQQAIVGETLLLNRPRVLAVADALIKHGNLKGRRLDALLEGVRHA